MAKPDPSDWPWSEFPDWVNDALFAAGFESAEQLEGMSRYQLRKVPGLGNAGIDRIHEVIPDPNADLDVEMIPQPHGGALLPGGVHGHRSPPGAPPSLVRRLSRDSYYEGIPHLAEIATGKVKVPMVGVCSECGHERTDPVTLEEFAELMVPFRDQVKALDVLAKYGIGSAKGVSREDLIEFLRDLSRIVQETLEDELGTDKADEISERIFQKWRRTFRDQLD